MEKVIVIVIVIVSSLLISSCGTPRVATQIVRESSADTVYLSNIKYDSIYVYQSHDRDYHPALGTLELRTLKPDTVFVKDVSVEYRYKLLRDTVKLIQLDSIPYQVTVIETKEITRPLTWFDHLTRISFWFLIGAIATYLFIKIKRVLKKY